MRSAEWRSLRSMQHRSQPVRSEGLQQIIERGDDAEVELRGFPLDNSASRCNVSALAEDSRLPLWLAQRAVRVRSFPSIVESVNETRPRRRSDYETTLANANQGCAGPPLRTRTRNLHRLCQPSSKGANVRRRCGKPADHTGSGEKA